MPFVGTPTGSLRMADKQHYVILLESRPPPVPMPAAGVDRPVDS